MEKTESGQHRVADNKVIWGHVFNWAIMILMTIAAFAAVGMELMSPKAVIAFIVALAFVQAAMQVYIFMHLKHERLTTSIFIVWGGMLGVIFALGIVWMV